MMEMAGNEANSAPNRADGEAFLNQLRATFAKMPNDIPLLLFTEKAKDDIFAQANRQVIRAFRDLTDKITLQLSTVKPAIYRPPYKSHSLHPSTMNDLDSIIPKCRITLPSQISGD